MIINFLNELSTKSIILASSSPRRKEIIEKLGFALQIIPSIFEENLDPLHFSHPSEFVKETAKGKTKEVVDRLVSKNESVDLVIGADTCVVLNGVVFGKPKDKADAVDMLTKLSGKRHEVITGFHLMSRQDGSAWDETRHHETTTVTFAPLSQELIKAYVDTGEPMDKAGGYGIQGLGGALIEGINGDYYNVMGFPLHKFSLHLLPILDKWRTNPGSDEKRFKKS